MSDAAYRDIPLTTDLTPRQRLLLVRAMEEASELTKACAKALRFGLDSNHLGRRVTTNAEDIRKEWEDLALALGELLP